MKAELSERNLIKCHNGNFFVLQIDLGIISTYERNLLSVIFATKVLKNTEVSELIRSFIQIELITVIFVGKNFTNEVIWKATYAPILKKDHLHANFVAERLLRNAN